MADRDVPKVSGALHIADGVIAELAGYTALASYGIVGMAAPTMQDGFAKLLPRQKLRRGILVDVLEGGAIIDLYVIIENGTNLAAVSKSLADSVRYVLEQFVQIKIADVRVHVQGIHMKKS
jgi:uncharacterized alkaline shock family protein YloU